MSHVNFYILVFTSVSLNHIHILELDILVYIYVLIFHMVEISPFSFLILLTYLPLSFLTLWPSQNSGSILFRYIVNVFIIMAV